VWITDEERRIKMSLDGSDHPVPFRISDLFGPFDLDLTGEDEREGEAHSEARVPAIFSGEARRGWTAAALQ
jgi:hypothetical protein